MHENGIGWAVDQLRDGARIRREGWNGKDMWLALEQADQWPPEEGYGGAKWLPFIVMYTAQGDFVPWLASQTDILALDWERVE